MKPYNFLTAIACLFITSSLTAQKYSFKPNKNAIFLTDVNIINVKGYDGTEIIVINNDIDYDEDNGERTRGLKKLNPYGLSDNSGIGLSIMEENDRVILTQTNNSLLEGEYEMRVPQNMDIYIENTSANADDLYMSGLAGEIVLSVHYSDISIEDVTGPMSVKSVYGDVNVVFNVVDQSSPSDIQSVYGFVDVSLPGTTKAEINMETIYGEIFSNMDLKIKPLEVSRKSNQCYDYGSAIKGTLNGGGEEIYIKANHDNIYLRKL